MRLIRDGEKGGYGGGGRGRLYAYRYTVTTRMTPALRWAAMRAILMFHNCEGQRHKTVSTNHNFWRERTAEAVSNRGPAYQPNALPLGQTGSRSHNQQLLVTMALGYCSKSGWWFVLFSLKSWQLFPTVTDTVWGACGVQDICPRIFLPKFQSKIWHAQCPENRTA